MGQALCAVVPVTLDSDGVCVRRCFLDPVGETPAETTELRARAMVEKKSTINLLEAFAVAVKHYLRGEDGIYYKYVSLTQHETMFRLLMGS